MNITSKLFIKQYIKIEDPLVAFIFVWYFAFEAWRSLFIRFLGESRFFLLYNVVFFGIATLALLTHGLNVQVPSLICYSIITILFLVTIIIHPEYMPWYFERVYGIDKMFFRGSGAIWAFLVVLLPTTREQMLKYYGISSWMSFFYLVLRYRSALRTGYWTDYSNDYKTIIKSSYSMGFGYNMLFPVLFFLAQAYLFGKKGYYIPFYIGTALILLAGSRGPIVCILAAFVIMTLYKVSSMDEKTQQKILIALFLSIPIFLLIYKYHVQISQGLLAFFESMGIHSRTLSMLLTGEARDDSGRNIIHQIAIERIKEGGLFGNGVLGERVAVGRRFRWGYAHNFFLEIYAAFGYIGGSAVIALLAFLIIKVGVTCANRIDQAIFSILLGASVKLYMSDSFWYYPHFWALLAFIVIIVTRQERHSVNENRMKNGSIACKYIKKHGSQN